MFKFNESYFEGVILKETSNKKRIEDSPLAKLANEMWESMTEEERKHAIENADKPF